jgi:protein involved in polysaccharide export with SLBB domain
MKKIIVIGIFLSGLLTAEFAEAQQIRQLPQSQQFRLAEGIVRIAEPGEMSDLVNIWGDVNAPGRFSIPSGTTLPELISYARGPASYRTGDTTLDWSKLRVEVSISRYSQGQSSDDIYNFRYRYTERAPEGMRNFVLMEDDIVSLEVKRRPSVLDYLRVIGPIASIAATTLLVVDRL